MPGKNSAPAARALDSFERPITALVQGASGGLGLAFVEQLLAGASTRTVFATCRRPDEARSLQQLRAVHPGRLELFPLDVTREASIAAAASELKSRRESLDLILNCSGILHSDSAQPPLQPEKRLDHVDPKALEESFRVNAFGPLLVLKHLAKLLPRRERSVVASLSARVGSIGDNRLGGWYSYRASKAALNMFYRTLAVELARTHPGCLCVLLHPGTVDTDLSRPFQARVPDGELFTPQRAAARLLAVLDGLDARQTGTFWAWDGRPVPW